MAKIDNLTLRRRFVANVPIGATIIMPNQPAVKIDSGPVIRLSHGPSDSKRETMGANPIERTIGRVYMIVSVDREEGDDGAYDLADACAAIFRNWRWTSGPDRLECGTPRVAVIDDATDPRFSIQISVPWESLHQY